MNSNLSPADRAFVLDFRRRVALTDGFRRPLPIGEVEARQEVKRARNAGNARRKQATDARAREALRLREEPGVGRTYSDIGRLLGVTRERARQLVGRGRELKGAR